MMAQKSKNKEYFLTEKHYPMKNVILGLFRGKKHFTMIQNVNIIDIFRKEIPEIIQKGIYFSLEAPYQFKFNVKSKP